MSNTQDNHAVIAWAQYLESYAREWVETFRVDRGSFSPEFWFLLVSCTLASWRGQPLTVSAACQSMMTGSASTRESRIKSAVAQGYLQKEPHGADGRATIVTPTARMDAMMRKHFTHTLGDAQRALRPDPAEYTQK